MTVGKAGKAMRQTALAVILIFTAACSEDGRYPPGGSGVPPPAQVAEASSPEADLPPAPTRREATIAVTGDLMVHADQLADAWRPETGTYDFTHCFEKVAGDLRAADLCIGNLETVLGGEAAVYSDYPRFNTPDSFGDALADAGFTFLTTANNHCMDRDVPGLLRTLDQLDRLGLGHTGTFRSRRERDNVALETVNGIRIALVSFTYGTNGLPLPQGEEHMVSFITRENVIATLQAARAQNPDWIVALPHIGNEYEPRPLPVFVEWIDLMIAHGADMVLASHPHVLQPMERREVAGADGQARSALVIYSLGNFLSSQREPPRDAGILLKLRIAGDGDDPIKLEEVRFLPTWVQFTDAAGQRRVRVLPIGDALRDYETGGGRYSLRPWDAARMRAAHSEITALYLGAPVPPEQTKREYLFTD